MTGIYYKRYLRGTASGFNLLPHNGENPAVFCTNDFSANWDAEKCKEHTTAKNENCYIAIM